VIIRSIFSRVTLIVVALLALAGCNSGRDGTHPARTGVASPSPSLDKRAMAERDAAAAYSAMWQAMAKAGEIPDPDAPELRQYATGDALARIVGVLVTYRETGVVSRGRPVDNPRATSANPADAPTEVHLVDCGDSTNWTKHNRATGELIKDDPRGRRSITAVVKLVDGTWKVTTFEVGDIGSC
jgi:hypothetical protein